MTFLPGRWLACGTAYVIVVMALMVANLLDQGHVGWYLAAQALTLPLGGLAVHPTLFLASLVSATTGGDAVNGNAASAVTVVLCFGFVAAANVAVIRTAALLLQDCCAGWRQSRTA
ncbi:MAG TPA: hypothetical protein VGE38_17270 [Nocardioides sp.]|uniref:hypothetical protein n=1 Tax=Nocardioides sp. TaxID=35761 RepID=UPI002ED7A019